MRYVISLVIVLLLNLTACSIFSPRDFGDAQQFTLNAVDTPETLPTTKLGNIAVEFPQVASELNTYRVALLRSDNKRDYYAGARWADFLPAIVQSTLVKTLENSGHFLLVSADYTNTNMDYVLRSDIQLFQADYTTSNPPTIVITIRFTLLNAQTQKIVTSQRIIQKVEAKQNSLSSIYSAYTSAFDAVQETMLDNILRTTKH